MPSKDTKILEPNQYQKSDKVPFNYLGNLHYIIEKINWCKNNSENSSTTKVSKHIVSGFSMFTISSFSGTENNPDVYGAKDCINKFCESLRGDTIKIINLIK